MREDEQRIAEPGDAGPSTTPPPGSHLAAPARDEVMIGGHAVAAYAPDDGEGRGRQPTSVGVMWTDQLGRVAMRAVQLLVVVAAIALVVWAGLQLTVVVIPVLLALIVSAATWPIIRFLTKKLSWPSVVATLVVLLALVIFVGGALSLVVLLVTDQWGTLSSQALDGLNQLISWANSTFPVEINEQQINDWIAQAQDFIFTSQFGNAAASGLSAGLSTVGRFATGAVLFIVVLFFFMKDGPMIWAFLLKPFKAASHRRAQLMGSRAVVVMGEYVRGTTIVALVDATLIGIALAVMGVPLAFPLALVVFITAYIPVVGATLAGVLAALVTLVTNGLVPALIVVAIVVLVNQVDGNLLQPFVLGKSLKLHALVVLIALAVGTILGGIVGTLLSVPIAAVVWSLVRSWYQPIGELEAEDADHDDGRKPLPWSRKKKAAEEAAEAQPAG